METLRPALQRVYMTRASAYRDALKSFIQGYQEGIQQVMEAKEDAKSKQQEDGSRKSMWSLNGHNFDQRTVWVSSGSIPFTVFGRLTFLEALFGWGERFGKWRWRKLCSSNLYCTHFIHLFFSYMSANLFGPFWISSCWGPLALSQVFQPIFFFIFLGRMWTLLAGIQRKINVLLMPVIAYSKWIPDQDYQLKTVQPATQQVGPFAWFPLQ